MSKNTNSIDRNTQAVLKIAPFLSAPHKYTAFNDKYLRPHGKSSYKERKLLKENGFVWFGGNWRLTVKPSADI